MLGRVVGGRGLGFVVGLKVGFLDGLEVTGALDGAAVKAAVGLAVGNRLALGFQVGVLVGAMEGLADVGLTEGAPLTGGLVMGFKDGDAEVVGPTLITKLGKR